MVHGSSRAGSIPALGPSIPPGTVCRSAVLSPIPAARTPPAMLPSGAMTITVRLFASLREHAGSDRLQVEARPGETVADLFSRLFPSRPSPDWPGPLMFAVDREWVAADHPVRDGVEVAFLPPLGGGSGDPRVLLTSAPLDAPALVEQVRAPHRGGICTFVGTARDVSGGRRVLRLEYEAWEEMALLELSRLCDEIEARWPGVAVAIAHRTGVIGTGEAAVVVACAAPHRAEAFEACRHGIDRLKERVPIFKKEVREDGSDWKGNESA